MQDFTAALGKVTIGLDLGDKYSHYHTVDAMGNSTERDRLVTTPEVFRAHFSGMKPARIVVEAGTHSPWVSRLLAQLGHEVLVANPRQLPLIYCNTKKSDQTDPENLARVGRLDPDLLKPLEHRSKRTQVDLATLRARDSLVAARTKLINHVRGSVKPLGARVPACSAPHFHQKAPEFIPSELQAVLAPVVKMIEELTHEIRKYDKLIARELCGKHPATTVLQQVNGVGPLTALAFVLILADPRRFKDSRTVGAYLGLTPRKDESGEQQPQLRITKAGDPFLRRLLVSSAQYILGPFGPDSDLKRFGQALSRRGGKNAKKRAVVAVARKLAVLLHRLWLTGEVFEPLRKRPAAKRNLQAPLLL
jgi:transposase